ncbi:unnamed protein product [Microthlaspi erraticum]|uniref:Uncharacterized protein n=1 Tax=Microthlaspi erraticum TaxID=1685480 RepID=A0A6D2HQF5_9BRAS|nr:unnamed protein product [Microthlaspi erraticum]
MREIYSSGPGNGEPPVTQIWRRKSSQKSSKYGEGRKSMSNSESVHSTHGKQRTPNHEKDRPHAEDEGTSSGSLQTPSVFNCIGSPQLLSGKGGNSNIKSSKQSQDSGGRKKHTSSPGNLKDKEERFKSISVLERFGQGGQEDEDHSQLKRRRLSNSDDRKSKKAKMGTKGEGDTPISVFQRLGESPKGAGVRNSGGSAGGKIHSALVAASVPTHFASSQAGESGLLWKEGLMGNTNPSKSQ